MRVRHLQPFTWGLGKEEPKIMRHLETKLCITFIMVVECQCWTFLGGGVEISSLLGYYVDW